MKLRKRNRLAKIDKRLSMNRHHLVNKCKGGGNQNWNIAILDIERHQYWHKVFGNLSLEEAIELLIRYKRIKDYQKNQKTSGS